MLNIFNFLRTKPLTREQIINETVKFYSADIKRRSSNLDGDSGCKYNSSNGTHCAVGRCLLPIYKNQGIELKGNTNGIAFFLSIQGLNSIDEAVVKKYRGHSLDFWRDLQDLHDTGKNWQLSGLTQDGKKFVEILKEKNYETEN